MNRAELETQAAGSSALSDASAPRAAAPGLMRARIEAALERGRSASLVSLSIPAPCVHADTLLRARGSAQSVLWAPPNATSFAGFGTAFELTAAGPGRFRECAAVGSALLRELPEVLLASEQQLLLPKPRLFGGFSFQTSAPGKPSTVPPWESFGEARFLLPRVRYANCGSSAWLSLTLRPEERDAARIEQELAELLELLERGRANGHPHPAEREAPHSGVGPASAHSKVLHAESSSLQSWRDLVEGILGVISTGQLDKIVAARKTRYTLKSDIDPLLVLEQLQGSPNVNRVALRFAEAELVAATPERLLQRAGKVIHTEALAGTLASTRPEAVVALLGSQKDQEEHAFVVREILRCLLPFCSKIEAAPVPVVRELRHVVHLQTPIVGELDQPEALHVLDLVEALHPTPAVGGVPRERALQWISEHEPLDRGWYAGPLGWFDAGGDGEFWVGLRAGVLHGNEAHLFAGAGIVRGSETDSEYAETEMKLTGLVRALGIVE